jgi:hypothetical protein
MKRTVIATLFTAALCTAASVVTAQTVSDVQFASGNFGAMVSGTIVGDDYIDYRLGAQAGQEMFVDLTVTDSNGSGIVYFNILAPGSDGMAIYNSSMDGNTTTVDLPSDGTYAIRVYQMGNDRDTGKTSGFTIDLSIQ